MTTTTTTASHAPPATRPVLTRRWSALLVGASGLLLAGMLSATDASAPEAFTARLKLALPHDKATRTGAPAAQTMRLADDGPAASAAPSAIAPELLQGPPERRLIGIYHLIAQNRLDEALRATDALTRTAPAFKLAQLVRADLLSARIAPLRGFGAGAAAGSSATAHAELAVLRDEARLRIRALQERPPAGAVPDEFVLLPPSVRFAVAVDTSRARLYLFENSEQGPRLIDDYYVSIGKQGVDKLVEGDQKTPLGVYFITDRIGQSDLEDRFGAGALPLNYPNIYDKSVGRTGSGILVHGVPSNTYSRPPLDSDGCVAMANEDLLKLSRQLPQRDTPVVITRQIKWVVPPASAVAAGAAYSATTAGSGKTSTPPDSAARAHLLERVTEWQQARLGDKRSELMALYGDNATDQDAEAAANFRQRLTSRPRGIDGLSVLTWHDDKDVMVVTFRELAAARGQRDRIVRQYWSRSGADWRIMAEASVR